MWKNQNSEDYLNITKEINNLFIDLDVDGSYRNDFEGIADLALLPNCKPRNWSTKRYQQFIKNAINKIDIVFIKIKSHSGDKYNEEVDKLCKIAFYKK